MLGIAVGTGNIWRFPRIAAQNGGDEGAGAFLIAWVVFLFMWSIPLIIAEYAIGRHGRKGVIGAFIRTAGPRFAWMGAFVAFVATAIMFYYSVVAGWCVYYFSAMVSSPLPISVQGATDVWEGFQSGGMPLLFHALMMGAGVLVVTRGITSIERVNKVLIPTLLVIVLVSVVRAVTLPGAGEGAGLSVYAATRSAGPAPLVAGSAHPECLGYRGRVGTHPDLWRVHAIPPGTSSRTRSSRA